MYPTERTRVAYYLSVDGGGTSTTLLAADADGRELTRAVVGSASFKAVGPAAAAANMARGLDALAAAGFPAAGAAASVWGLSGCDSPADQAAYQAILADLGLAAANHHVCNDALLALHTAAAAPAVALISGTGSIAYAVNTAGQTRRAGGWNYAFSDLGSGYWMGAELLRAFALQADGALTGEAGENGEIAPVAAAAATAAAAAAAAGALDPAFAAIRAALNLPDGISASAMRQQLEGFTSPAGFATLAFEVLSSADTQTSPLCADIIARAAACLANYVAPLAAWLTATDPAQPAIVCAGGMMKIPAFRCALEKALRRVAPQASITYPTKDPVWGGITMAKERLFYEE